MLHFRIRYFRSVFRLSYIPEGVDISSFSLFSPLYSLTHTSAMNLHV